MARFIDDPNAPDFVWPPTDPKYKPKRVYGWRFADLTNGRVGRIWIYRELACGISNEDSGDKMWACEDSVKYWAYLDASVSVKCHYTSRNGTQRWGWTDADKWYRPGGAIELWTKWELITGCATGRLTVKVGEEADGQDEFWPLVEEYANPLGYRLQDGTITNHDRFVTYWKRIGSPMIDTLAPNYVAPWYPWAEAGCTPEEEEYYGAGLPYDYEYVVESLDQHPEWSVAEASEKMGLTEASLADIITQRKHNKAAAAAEPSNGSTVDSLSAHLRK